VTSLTPADESVALEMMADVVGLAHDDEVARVIVEAIAIHVVDALGAREAAAEEDLHDDAMDEDAFAAEADAVVVAGAEAGFTLLEEF